MKRIKYFEAILELSKEKTLNTISVRDIANNLDTSTGSLYYQFRSKEDLINQMFVYYRTQANEFLLEVDNDPYTFFSTYLRYNLKHNLEFKFIYSSEISNMLNDQSIEVALATHLALLDKIGLNLTTDAHMVAIIFGTMRAYLMAPAYIKQCEPDQVARELASILNNYKKTSNI